MEKISDYTSNVENSNLLVMRHLRDLNDLRNSRDSGLESNQEEETIKMSEAIYNDFESSDARAIFLSVSNKKRTLETASLIKEYMKNKHPEVKIFINSDDDLVDLDHGDYNLPEDYEVGDYFSIFEDAWRFFIEETFNKSNPDYRFGESYIDESGEIKYPELSEYFTRTGESYRYICIRLYTSILNLYKNKERFDDGGVKPYVITHSLPYGIFRSMVGVAQKYENGNLDFETGDLMTLCWEYYNSGELGRSTYGQISEVPNVLLENDDLMGLLKSERDFLIKNKNG